MKKVLNQIMRIVVQQRLSRRIIQIAVIHCLVMATLCLANEDKRSPGAEPWAFEIENQTPCFFFGGYQLSLGTRYDQFRVRVEIQNSGSMNLGQFAIDHRNGNFQRNIDNISVGIMGDYFISQRFFVTGSLETRNWKIHDEPRTSESHMRTLDAGIGAGYQYIFYQNFFVQLAAALNFRQNQTVTVGGSEYRIPNMDCLPMIRLGVRF